MKRILGFIFLAFVSQSFCQTTAIPDPNFEDALIDLGLDVGPIDGFVPTANIDTVVELNVDYEFIGDLTGDRSFCVFDFFELCG